MNKRLIILMTLALFAVAAPVLAEEGHTHGVSHSPMDEQCQKECEMLIRNCSQEVDSLQQRIKKLDDILNEKGATNYTRDELKKLEQQLQDAEETLRRLERR